MICITQLEISFILENELLKVNNCLYSNEIKINIDKSNFIYVSFRNDVSFPPLKFGNNFISQIAYTKFLGNARKKWKIMLEKWKKVQCDFGRKTPLGIMK